MRQHRILIGFISLAWGLGSLGSCGMGNDPSRLPVVKVEESKNLIPSDALCMGRSEFKEFLGDTLGELMGRTQPLPTEGWFKRTVTVSDDSMSFSVRHCYELTLPSISKFADSRLELAMHLLRTNQELPTNPFQFRMVWEMYYYCGTDIHPIGYVDNLPFIEVTEDGGRRVSRYSEIRGRLSRTKQVKKVQENDGVEYAYSDIYGYEPLRGKPRKMEAKNWKELDGCFTTQTRDDCLMQKDTVLSNGNFVHYVKVGNGYDVEIRFNGFSGFLGMSIGCDISNGLIPKMLLSDRRKMLLSRGQGSNFREVYVCEIVDGELVINPYTCYRRNESRDLLVYQTCNEPTKIRAIDRSKLPEIVESTFHIGSESHALEILEKSETDRDTLIVHFQSGLVVRYVLR